MILPSRFGPTHCTAFLVQNTFGVRRQLDLGFAGKVGRVYVRSGWRKYFMPFTALGQSLAVIGKVMERPAGQKMKNFCKQLL